jgi:lipid-binding SYLF domain-containing protein
MRAFDPMNLSARNGRSAAVALLLSTLALPCACSSSNNGQANSAANQKMSGERKDAVVRLDSATALVNDFRGKVPYEVAKEVRCVVAIPAMVSGGLVFGGRSGRGFADCRDSGSQWSAPSPVSISGGSFGAQIGVQSVDVLALLVTDKAKAALMSGHFQVGVDASAAAGTVGTGTSSDFKLGSDVLTYTRSQGLFAGATINGASISPDDDATAALYGSKMDLYTLLSEQRPMPDPAAERFVSVVRDSFGPTARPLAMTPSARAAH